MTARELDTMVNAMRTRFNKVETRMDITNYLYYLSKGLLSIGRKDLSFELMNLCYEIDGIDSIEIVKNGTFR